MTRKLEIVFLGSSLFGLPALRAMTEAGHAIRAVVTQPDRRRGRGRQAASPPLKEHAAALGLAVLQPEKVGEIVPDLERIAPDAIVTAAYAQFLTSKVIRSPKIASINIHPSLLPRYRGAAPIQWAIINGDDETGVTIFRIVRRMDSGPILARRSVAIGESETAPDLEERLSRLGADLLLEVLEDLPAALEAEKVQDEALVTFAPRLKKDDGRLSFDRPSREIGNRVRGLQPWPGAYTAIRREGSEPVRVRILEARVGGDAPEAPPGEVIEATDEGITVAAGEGWVMITRLQPEGGKEMPAADFLRGRPVSPGDRLG